MVVSSSVVLYSQICIAFALHRGLAVIPKTISPARILENLRATNLSLSDEDMGRLTEVDKNYRLFNIGYFMN